MLFNLELLMDRLFGWADGAQAQKWIRYFVWVAFVGTALLGLVNAEGVYNAFMGYQAK